MNIGIGLPNSVIGAQGQTLLDWARRAEERGFSTLATIGRVAYPTYDELVTLAGAAGATQRIGLMTNVLLGPTRNPVLLAKAAASLDQISGGRFILGVGVGGRPDDFPTVGKDFHTRGHEWDQALELMHRAWKGEPVPGSPMPVTPRPTHGDRVPMIFGGTSDTAVERTVRWGIGWAAGGAAPDQIKPFVQRIRQAWKDGGREGQPKIVALVYFALGANAQEGGTAYARDYYSFAPWWEQLARSIPRTPEALRDTVKRFEDATLDELIIDPTIAEVEQVDLLADAVLKS